MVSLKDLRNRIDAIKSTEKITSAMKMVAAAKLRHVQELISKGEVYRTNIYKAVERILYIYNQEYEQSGKSYNLPEIVTGKEGVKNNYLLIVLASDKGLCGSYNMMVARKAKNRIEELRAAGKEVKLICYGLKAYNILKKEYAEIIIRNEESVANDGVGYNEAESLAEMLLEMYKSGAAEVCEIVYGKFISAMVSEMVSQQILPMDIEHLETDEINDMVGDVHYEAEPNNEILLSYLLPLVFKEMIFNIMINSQASEQGARMTSMDNATRNAGEMISKLTLKYNRLRQSAITTELIEIIAGAEAI